MDRPAKVSISDGWSRSLRKGDPVVLAAASLFAVLLVWTLLIVATPTFRFEVVWPRARLPIETTGAVVAILVAALAYLRYSLTWSRPWLFIGLAFLVIGLNRLALGVLIPPGRFEIGPRLEVYLWTGGRLLAAGLLLMGVVPTSRQEDPSVRLRRLITVSILALAVFGATQAALWVSRDSLPELAAVDEAVEDASFTGPLPGLTATDITLGTVGTALFLAAAGFALLRTRTLELPGWLAPALLLAAFSHLHYMFFPTVFTTRISTGDLLRLSFSLALLGGLLWEVRRSFLAERDRSAALAAAYEAERARVRELQELERAKTELFGIVTHELMNPVASLRGFVATLANRWSDLDPGTTRDLLDRLDRESRRLRDLAEEAITATHLDSNEFQLVRRREHAVELAREASGMVGDLQGRLKVVIAPEAEVATVDADVARILQVFRNLLSNAEKYSDPLTPIELRVWARGDEVVFSVTDQGPGIAPEDHPRLFNRFSRVRPAGKEHVQGSGLGLYISRRIVEAHGGRLWVESELGAGATFSLALPSADGRPGGGEEP